MINKLFIWVLMAYFPFAGDSSVKFEDFRNEPSFKEEIDFNHIDYHRINEVIFYLTNEIRTKNKLKPLVYTPELEKSAMMHAHDMVTGKFFSHFNDNDARKHTPNDRAKLCNISNPFLAENLIEGYGLQYTSYETAYLRGKGKFSLTPNGDLIKAHTYLSFGEAQMTGWMNSKEHRKNILSKDAIQMGCGAAIFTNHDFNDMPSFFVVQNFQWFQPIKTNNP